jgi:DNA-binding XRE family transcriptional regulator
LALGFLAHAPSLKGQQNMSDGCYVYVIGPRNGPLKIGIAKNVETRRSIANVGNASYLFIHHKQLASSVDEAQTIELEAHHHFSQKHIRGEWFSLTENDLPAIRQVMHTALMIPCVSDGWSLSRKTAEEFTPEVLKIARNAVGLSNSELAAQSGIKLQTIVSFESGGTVIDRTLEALKAALEKKGVEFIPQGPNQRFKVLI